jgi:S-DNA-T family DNA segregation ATPase FtsK/SpoIIIE
MSRSDERSAALRFCLTTAGLLGCLFAWVSVLSFDSADPPATSVAPANVPPLNLCGPVGAWVAYTLFYYLGTGTYALLALLTVGVFAWPRGALRNDLWLRFVGLGLTCAAVSAWGAMWLSPLAGGALSGPGGVLGAALKAVTTDLVQEVGAHMIFFAAFAVGLLLAADELVVRLFRWARWTGRRSVPVLLRGGSAVAGAGAAAVAGVTNGVAQLSQRRSAEHAASAAEADDDDQEEEEEVAAKPASESLALPPRQLTFEEEEGEEVDATEAGARAAGPAAGEKRRLGRRGTPAPPVPAAPGPAQFPPPDEDEYELPPLALLDPALPVDKQSIEILCREKAYILEQTLNEFRLEVQVVAIETGPVITVFELKLAPGIKVSQIASLSNDMARALKAPAVRGGAPRPGKNTIGIEVPNVDKEKVRIREVIEASNRRTATQAIPLFLGKDASGQPLVADLAQMPHLLIAGTTGSGKSVCISSIIMSILMTRTPTQVQLILVDPKVVELAMYKDVPHLMCPIVTEVPRAEGILDWAATKMDERYALLAEAGVKDIRSYNRLGREGLQQRLNADDAEMERLPVYLPYIVIMIDELADLMMTSAKEVEFYLCRLAQKSRAVGIHLIVSTQRPQANVVTGLIKSNLPSRIAFRVSSRLDSRIVLDQNGGEVLMGQGDMLFLPPGSSKLLRAQGTFVADDELRSVVKHCAAQRQQRFHPELTRMPGADASADGERDELFDQAVELIIESGRGSVSLLQRRLTVGYGRASRLIDQMYAAGIVGEYKGSQAREVLLTADEWHALRDQRNREEAEEAEEAAEYPGNQA